MTITFQFVKVFNKGRELFYSFVVMVYPFLSIDTIPEGNGTASSVPVSRIKILEAKETEANYGKL